MNETKPGLTGRAFWEEAYEAEAALAKGLYEALKAARYDLEGMMHTTSLRLVDPAIAAYESHQLPTTGKE